jgi:hypothetical protein
MTPIEQNSDVPEFAMTELEERLREPDGKAVAATICAHFDKLIKDLEQSKKHGLAPEEFAGTETLLKAVAAAVQTVIAFTEFHHPASGVYVGTDALN